MAKYRYVNVLQGDYGQGWEDICQSEIRPEIVSDLLAYKDNAPEYRYRIIRRREVI